MKKNKCTLVFASLPENVMITRTLAAALGAQLKLTMDQLEELRVAVSEAVSNAIIHGYKSDPSRFVTLDMDVSDDFVRIEVTDTGCGIENIPQAMEPSYSTDPERMGLGFVFMQSFMDDLQVESTPGHGTKVIMQKRLRHDVPLSH